MIVVTNVTCARELDIVLVLDQSTSIVAESWQNWYVRVLGFAKSIAGAFVIGRNMTQVGLMKFNETAEIVFHLNKYDDRQSLLNAIGNVAIVGGDTNIAAALRTAREMMFTEQNGARPGVPKILILLTDGTANFEESNTMPEANLTKAAGIKLYTVGVTHAVDEDQLRVMASVPECFFFAPNFTLLNSVVQQIVENSCNETATTSELIKLCITWRLTTADNIINGANILFDCLWRLNQYSSVYQTFNTGMTLTQCPL